MYECAACALHVYQEGDSLKLSKHNSFNLKIYRNKWLPNSVRRHHSIKYAKNINVTSTNPTWECKFWSLNNMTPRTISQDWLGITILPLWLVKSNDHSLHQLSPQIELSNPFTPIGTLSFTFIYLWFDLGNESRQAIPYY